MRELAVWQAPVPRHGGNRVGFTQSGGRSERSWGRVGRSRIDCRRKPRAGHQDLGIRSEAELRRLRHYCGTATGDAGAEGAAAADVPRMVGMVICRAGFGRAIRMHVRGFETDPDEGRRSLCNGSCRVRIGRTVPGKFERYASLRRRIRRKKQCHRERGHEEHLCHGCSPWDLSASQEEVGHCLTVLLADVSDHS